jgi:dimeric dUTPase (all-alpha-NTP-PPase superfamily)
VNITDVEINLEGDFDKLEKIFELQGGLREKYEKIERDKGGFIPNPSLPIIIDSCLHQEYLKSLIFRVIVELVEAADCLKNKLWKQTEVITDVEHFHEELVDGLHFYIELCIVLGIDASKLFELYFKKQEVNKWRQATKY